MEKTRKRKTGTRNESMVTTEKKSEKNERNLKKQNESKLQRQRM